MDDPCEVKVRGIGHSAGVPTAANGTPAGSTRVRKAMAAAYVVSSNNNTNRGLVCVPEHAGGDASCDRIIEEREERRERSAEGEEVSTSARPGTGKDDGTTTNSQDVKRVELGEDDEDDVSSVKHVVHLTSCTLDKLYP